MSLSYGSLILASLALGFLLGLYFEFFRILRRAIAHSTLWVALEDFLFFVCAAFGYYLICFSFAMGSIRWFSVLSLISGFVFYLQTLGKLLTFFSVQIIGAVKRFFVFWKLRVLLPLTGLLFRFLRYFLSPVRLAHKSLREFFKRKQLKQDKRRLLRLASRGFRRS